METNLDFRAHIDITVLFSKQKMEKLSFNYEYTQDSLLVNFTEADINIFFNDDKNTAGYVPVRTKEDEEF